MFKIAINSRESLMWKELMCI